MSRRYFELFMLLLVLSLTLSGCTSSSEGLIPNSIEKWFKLVFVDLPNKSVNDPQYVFTMKVLFTLLAFSVLFGASQLVLKNYAKNVRLAICFLLALISTLMIPGELLSTVAKSYGVVFAAVMIGAPVIGAVYLMFGVLNEPNRTHWAAKFGICVLMWYILGTFANQNLQIATTETRMVLPGLGSAVISRTTEVIGAFSGGLSWLFLIGAIIYAAKFVMGEEKDEELPEEAKKAFGAVKRWLGTKSVGSLFTDAPKLLDQLEAAIGARDSSAAEGVLRKETRIVENFAELIGRAQDSVQHVTGAGRRDLRRIIGELSASENAITIALDGVRTALRAGPDWRTARGGVQAAQRHMRMAVANVVRLRRLIK